MIEIEFNDHDIDLMSVEDGDRFIVKIKNQLYLVSNEHSVKLDINLSSTGIITQILPTQNSDHVQFMFYDN